MSCCDNCNNGCNCNDDPCYEDDATTCSHNPTLTTNAAGKKIITTCSDYTVDKGIDQVDVTKSGVTITVPTDPEPGDSFIVTAPVANVTVITDPDATPSPVQRTVPNNEMGTFVYTTRCEWVSSLPIDG